MSLLAAAATGCATLLYSPVFVLSLHEFSDLGGGRLEVGVRDAATRRQTRRISRYSFLSSREIESAEVYGPATNGKYGLEITVSRWFANEARTTANSNRGGIFAVLVDGEYMDCAHFTRGTYEGERFVLEPVFNEYMAKMIAKHAKDNFDYFSRRRK